MSYDPTTEAAGRDWIPVRFRAVLYRILTTVLGLNLVFGFFDDGVVAKIVGGAAVFGYGLASTYTPLRGEK